MSDSDSDSSDSDFYYGSHIDYHYDAPEEVVPNDAAWVAMMQDETRPPGERNDAVIEGIERGSAFVNMNRDVIRAYLEKYPSALGEILSKALRLKNTKTDQGPHMYDRTPSEKMCQWLQKLLFTDVVTKYEIPVDLQISLVRSGGLDHNYLAFTAMNNPSTEMIRELLLHRPKLSWFTAEHLPDGLGRKFPEFPRKMLELKSNQNEGAKVLKLLGGRVTGDDFLRALQCAVRDGWSDTDAVRAIVEMAPEEFRTTEEFGVALANTNCDAPGMIAVDIRRSRSVLKALANTVNGARVIWDYNDEIGEDPEFYRLAEVKDKHMLTRCKNPILVDLQRHFRAFPTAFRDALNLLDLTFEDVAVAVECDGANLRHIQRPGESPSLTRRYSAEQTTHLYLLAAMSENLGGTKIPKNRVEPLTLTAWRMHKNFCGIDWFFTKGKRMLPIPIAIIDSHVRDFVFDQNESNKFTRLVHRMRDQLQARRDETAADRLRYQKWKPKLSLMRKAERHRIHCKPFRDIEQGISQRDDFELPKLFYRRIEPPKATAAAASKRFFVFNEETQKYEAPGLALVAHVAEVAPVAPSWADIRLEQDRAFADSLRQDAERKQLRAKAEAEQQRIEMEKGNINAIRALRIARLSAPAAPVEEPVQQDDGDETDDDPEMQYYSAIAAALAEPAALAALAEPAAPLLEAHVAKRSRADDEAPEGSDDEPLKKAKRSKANSLTKTENFAHHAKAHAVGADHQGAIIRICNLRFPATLKIAFVQNNPKKPGSQAYGRYEIYKQATTLGQFDVLTLSRWSALYYDFEHGFVAIE